MESKTTSDVSFVLTRSEVFWRGRLHPFSWIYTAQQDGGILNEATGSPWYCTGTRGEVIRAAKHRATLLDVRFVLVDRTR